jgi:phage protein D
MKKTMLSIAIVLLTIPFGPPAFAGTVQPVAPIRPFVTIEGMPHSELTDDILSVSIDNQANKLVLILTNISKTTPGFTYSDGSLLLPGVRISVTIGPSYSMNSMFEGIITTCTAEFSSGTASTLTVTAICKSQPRKKNVVSLNYGTDLNQLSAVLNSKRQIICSGTVSGNPDIQPGTRLVIDKLGLRYSQTYTVTGTVHAYDPKTGYTTSFKAVTTVSRIYSSLSPDRHPHSNRHTPTPS